jgi:hypothetical protein
VTSIALSGNGTRVAFVNGTFNEVSEQFAFEEGEGNRSLAYWRRAHETTFVVITSRIERLTRRCRLLANGSRSSTQSNDAPSRVKAALQIGDSKGDEDGAILLERRSYTANVIALPLALLAFSES